jgi:hypothetical protein
LPGALCAPQNLACKRLDRTSSRARAEGDESETTRPSEQALAHGGRGGDRRPIVATNIKSAGQDPAEVATYLREHCLRRYSRCVAVTLEGVEHARSTAEDHNANPCEPRRCCRSRQGADRWRKPELRPRALSTILRTAEPSSAFGRTGLLIAARRSASALKSIRRLWDRQRDSGVLASVSWRAAPDSMPFRALFPFQRAPSSESRIVQSARVCVMRWNIPAGRGNKSGPFPKILAR